MDWLWKLLGYHVCEEFTPWQRVEHVAVIKHICGWTGAAIGESTVSRQCQERACKACGKIEQKPLRHFARA